MAPKPAWLRAALPLHLAGRFADAERIYQSVLRAAPAEADALNLLGLIAAYRNRYDEAAHSIGRAIELRPGRGDFHAALGNVHLAQGRDAEMTACYRQALLLEYFTAVPAPFSEIVACAGGAGAQTSFAAPLDVYRSQSLQDVFLDRWVFQGEREAAFIDIGAHDGVTYSNSFFFEQARGWKGVCIEPNPDVFARLVANRSAVALNCCVAAQPGRLAFQKVSGPSDMLSGIAASYSAEHRTRIAGELERYGGSSALIDVEARTLAGIAEQHGLRDIAYLSIDTEGSELDILRATDFQRIFVHAVTVECNFDDVKDATVTLMTSHGFDRVMALSHDLVFVHRSSLYRARLAHAAALAASARSG